MSALPEPLSSVTVVVAFSFSTFAVSAAAQVRGAAAGLRSGLPDKPAMAAVTRCLGRAPGRPRQFYSRGGWYATDDVEQQIRQREGAVEAIAMVWSRGAQPRAIYQWNHDGEFNRDLVACLDDAGRVSSSESRYTPGDSEPDQRWIYIHTLALNSHSGDLRGSGRFTDRSGHPMGRPHLTPEDQDFISGERVYHQLSDFDFAGLLHEDARGQHP